MANALDYLALVHDELPPAPTTIHMTEIAKRMGVSRHLVDKRLKQLEASGHARRIVSFQSSGYSRGTWHCTGKPLRPPPKYDLSQFPFRSVFADGLSPWASIPPPRGRAGQKNSTATT